MRGLLREFGIFIPVGAARVVPRVRELLAEPTSRRARADPFATPGRVRRDRTLEDNIRGIERQLAESPNRWRRCHCSRPSRGRLADGHGARRARGRHPSVRLRAALRQFSWPDPEGIFQCVATAPRRDQQARGRLRAHAPRAGARSVLWHAKRGRQSPRRFNAGHARRSSDVATTSRPSPSRTSSLASSGRSGCTQRPFAAERPTPGGDTIARLNSPADCTELDIVAHRSDRRGDDADNRLALEAVY